MALQFALNDETAEATLASDIAAIEELTALESQCDKVMADLEHLNHTMEINHAGIALVETLKEALHSVIPAMTDAVEPVKNFAKGMAEVRGEMGSTSFRNW